MGGRAGNESNPGQTGDPGPGSGAVPEILCPDGQEKPGRRVLRRLTGEELETTVRSVFGLDAAQFPGFCAAPRSGLAGRVHQQRRSVDRGQRLRAGLRRGSPPGGRSGLERSRC